MLISYNIFCYYNNRRDVIWFYEMSAHREHFRKQLRIVTCQTCMCVTTVKFLPNLWNCSSSLYFKHPFIPYDFCLTMLTDIIRQKTAFVFLGYTYYIATESTIRQNWKLAPLSDEEKQLRSFNCLCVAGCSPKPEELYTSHFHHNPKRWSFY